VSTGVAVTGMPSASATTVGAAAEQASLVPEVVATAGEAAEKVWLISEEEVRVIPEADEQASSLNPSPAHLPAAQASASWKPAADAFLDTFLTL